MEDVRVHVKLRLSALWASVMFCYIYADYFGLYTTGKLGRMMAGKGPWGHTTQGALVVVSLVMAIPSLMIFLCVALKPRLNRWLNIVTGILYTAIILVSMWGWAFYIVYGVIEVALTSLVVWYAWRWPKQAGGSSPA